MQGVAAAAVDTIARGALGHRMGPLGLLDFAGPHTHLASSQTAYREFRDPRYRPIPLARALVRAGPTGRAAGRGFYDYESLPPAQARARVLRGAESGGVAMRLAGRLAQHQALLAASDPRRRS
jgi:3-hydroxybutyryl-CoA dehydrogenase